MPKKGKKGEKEKKSKKKFWMNERETVSYEQQILDNNRQIARLRERNEELEDEAEALKEKLRQLEEDRADVAAHLKRVLHQKTEEARELSERLIALDELRKEELIAYKKKEDAMELEYYNMESNLSAEVKLAAGKLNALEDWRNARIDLMRKFEIQEEQMAEQEERHNRIIYEAEKALIIGKAKVKKEMEERLNELAQSFREATNIRIADATHRAVRENIALNKELDTMFKVCRELEARAKESKENERTLRLQASLFYNEAKMALNKALKQNRLIDKLAENHFNMTLKYGQLQREQAKTCSIEVMAKEYKEKCENVEKKVKILEQHVQRTRGSKEEVLKDVNANCQEIERLCRILGEARKCIEEALQLQTEAGDEDICISCYPNVKEKLLFCLLDILAKKDVKTVIGSEIHSQPQVIQSQYTLGSLGLVPNQYSVDETEGKWNRGETAKREQAERMNVKIGKRESQQKIEKREEEGMQKHISECTVLDSGSSDILSPQETVSSPSSVHSDNST